MDTLIVIVAYFIVTGAVFARDISPVYVTSHRANHVHLIHNVALEHLSSALRVGLAVVSQASFSPIGQENEHPYHYWVEDTLC